MLTNVDFREEACDIVVATASRKRFVQKAFSLGETI
jgi:hypothetical protein